MPDELRRIEHAGFDAHLLKPFHLRDLLALLEAA